MLENVVCVFGGGNLARLLVGCVMGEPGARAGVLFACKRVGDEARSFEGACLSNWKTDFDVCVLCVIGELRAAVDVWSVSEESVGRSRDSEGACVGPEGGVDSNDSLCSIELSAIDRRSVRERNCGEARVTGGSCGSSSVRGNGVDNPRPGTTMVCSQRSKQESAD
jgi:hypothetical protein